MIYKVLKTLLPSIKLHPIVAVQAQMPPYATYQLIDTNPLDDVYDTSTHEKRVQINVYGRSHIQVVGQCKTIYKNLQRKSGIINGEAIVDIRFIDERDINIEEKKVFGRQLDYKIIFQ